MFNYFLKLLSLPFISLFVYVWTVNRQSVVDFHHRRHLYGRICSIYRTDLIELQTPSSPPVHAGQSFAIVENDPFTAGRSSRRVLGEAKVLFTGPSWAVCSFSPSRGRSAIPSAGDLLFLQT